MAQPLNILCFGDSLTAGYSQYGMRFTPYSHWLQAKLALELEGIFEIEVVTDGVSGELVTRGFRERMQRQYSSKKVNMDPYDWVIFLGGTNDLGWGKKPPEIWAEIKRVTQIALDAGAKVLLMTIPECAVVSASLDAKRDAINKLIMEDKRDWVFKFDLHAEMPSHSLSPEERQELWDDGLHFTPAGYEKIGNMVADSLLKIMDPSHSPSKEDVVEVKDGEGVKDEKKSSRDSGKGKARKVN